jgi:hypothetical protein
MTQRRKKVKTMIRRLQVLFAVLLSLDWSRSLSKSATAAFAPPLGINALLFKPRVKVVKSEGDEGLLIDAGKFFVDAFW